jgi:RNase adaptor protein for sRNA GlmZ degradation
MNAMKVILLYGLPCSGKSSVLRVMSDFHAIAVDTIIKKITPDPSISDFKRFSKEIVETAVSEVAEGRSSNCIIEMGCLISKQAIDQIECSLAEVGAVFINIKLSAHKGELIQRIVDRNRDIQLGNSNGIKVDGPDYLSRFEQVFDNNHPDNLIEIDTTGKTAERVSSEILEYLSLERN